MDTRNQKTILLVEDEVIIGMAQAQTIKDFGYEVVTAYSGEVAVQMIAETKDIDLVLMDIDLGQGIDGTEAARQILAMRNIPIVFLTSHAEKMFVDKVKKITGYGYVIKNSGNFVLQASIEMAFELFQAHAKTQENEAHLSATLSSIGDAMIAADKHCRVTLMNPVAEALTGWTVGEARGKPLSEVFHIINAHTRKICESPAEKTLSIGTVTELANHTILIARNGIERQIADSASSIRDGAGNITGVVLVFRDVTAEYRVQKSLQKSKETAERYLNVAAEIIISIDKQGIITLLNDNGHKILGYNKGELVGKDWFNLCLPAGIKEEVRAVFDKLMTDPAEDILTYENPVITRSGEERLILWHNTLLKNEDGTTDALLCAGEDVTERRQAEQAAAESETRYYGLMANSIDAVYLLNEWGSVVEANSVACSLLGYSHAELLACNIGDIDVNFSPEAFKEFWKDHPKEQPRLFETIHRHKNGTEIPVEVNGNIFYQGEEKYLYGVARNITERKRAEQALQASEERFQLAINGANDGLWDWNLRTDKVYYSPRWKEMLGYEDHELENHLDTWQRLLHPDDSEVAWQKFQAYMAGEAARFETEFRMRHKQGGWVTILSRANKKVDPDTNQPIRLVGTHVDLTPLREAERKLRDNERQLKKAQEITRLGYYDFHIDKQEWASSEILDDIFGIGEEYSRNVNGWLQIIHPDCREAMRHYLWDDVITRHTPFDKEYKIINQTSNQTRWVHGLGELVFDKAGNVLRMFGTIQDITDRKQAEEALQASEERHRKISELISDWAYSMTVHRDGSMSMDWISGSMERITGYDQTTITPDEDWIQKIHPDDLPLFQKNVGRILIKNKKMILEYRLRRSDGEYIWILDTAQPVWDDAEQRVVSVFGASKDISEQKQLAEQVKQHERLAAVGQLAAGIAHDFNNILTGILGFAELLELNPNLPAMLRPMVASIHDSGRRAAHLVRQILDFSRKSMRQPTQLNLAHLIRDSVMSVDRIIPENIRIDTKLLTKTCLVEADSTQIEQLFSNLVVNARDAMPNGGELGVTVAEVNLPVSKECAVCNQPIVGRWICLNVTDTGTGMSPETIDHIFEPFFTTKEVGQGSGLGLAQVYGIVEQHRGHISVESQVGQGTTFTIYLPPSDPKPATPAAETVSFVSGHGETILLVEGDPGVLEVNQSMLTHLGYRVLVATNGQAAIDTYRKNQDTILMVLSGVNMPDMDGAVLFDTLKALNPSVKMVLMSGYPLDDKGRAMMTQGLMDWFQRPITFYQLSKIIDKALTA
jgi:PAS domain S-box-containing protein